MVNFYNGSVGQVPLDLTSYSKGSFYLVHNLTLSFAILRKGLGASLADIVPYIYIWRTEFSRLVGHNGLILVNFVSDRYLCYTVEINDKVTVWMP